MVQFTLFFVIVVLAAFPSQCDADNYISAEKGTIVLEQINEKDRIVITEGTTRGIVFKVHENQTSGTPQHYSSLIHLMADGSGGPDCKSLELQNSNHILALRYGEKDAENPIYPEKALVRAVSSRTCGKLELWFGITDDLSQISRPDGNVSTVWLQKYELDVCEQEFDYKLYKPKDFDPATPGIQIQTGRYVLIGFRPTLYNPNLRIDVASLKRK